MSPYWGTDAKNQAVSKYKKISDEELKKFRQKIRYEIKIGKRKTKCRLRQRYQCKSCNHKFVNDPIKGYKADAKLITLSMDLYFKGLKSLFNKITYL